MTGRGSTLLIVDDDSSTLLVLVILAVVLPFMCLHGQVQQRDASFDTVSVKLVRTPVPFSGTTGFLPGGRYVARNANVLTFIVVAYRPAGVGSLGGDQIDVSRVPSWISSSLYNVEARAENPPPNWGTDAVDQPYLRSMLRDRFKLEAHFEKRDVPVYWMTVARPDRGLGPNMKRTVTPYDCEEVARLRHDNPSALPAPVPQRPLCTVMWARTEIAGGNVSIAQLAQALRPPIGAPVIDHTGLTGYFDVDVHYSDARGVTTSDPTRAPSIAEWPTLISAIGDQLGLKLERHRESADVLVVDRVERPTED